MKQTRRDLNQLLTPLPTVTDQGKVEVVFRNVRDRLLEFAQGFDAIVGCMAYLTDKSFVSALCQSEKLISLITLDNESHRQVKVPFPNYDRYIESVYYQDTTFIPALYEDNLEQKLGYGPLDYNPGWRFRPFYYFPEDNDGARLHHKFLVFLKKRLVVLDNSDESWLVHPWDQRTVYLDTVAVWTGSFNLSRNANYSLENGVIIHSSKIAQAYFSEFFQIVRHLDGYR